VVVVKDWRLGAMHYGMMFGIFIYVITTVVLDRGFMLKEQVRSIAPFLHRQGEIAAIEGLPFYSCNKIIS
jgi:hypothetical protein